MQTNVVTFSVTVYLAPCFPLLQHALVHFITQKSEITSIIQYDSTEIALKVFWLSYTVPNQQKQAVMKEK